MGVWVGSAEGPLLGWPGVGRLRTALLHADLGVPLLELGPDQLLSFGRRLVLRCEGLLRLATVGSDSAPSRLEFGPGDRDLPELARGVVGQLESPSSCCAP